MTNIFKPTARKNAHGTLIAVVFMLHGCSSLQSSELDENCRAVERYPNWVVNVPKQIVCVSGKVFENTVYDSIRLRK